MCKVCADKGIVLQATGHNGEFIKKPCPKCEKEVDKPKASPRAK